MGFFNKYPYTNEHELNLDWIIAKINALKDRVKAVEDAIHDIVVVTPNNGKLTIKRNNTIIGDFTADQATDENINIVVPENTSDLNNDSDFITSSDLPDMSDYYDKDETDALLSDKADISSLASVATSGNYNDLSNKPTIPAAQVNSDWNANSGVAQILNKPTIPAAQVNSDWNANSGVAEILNKPTLAAVATSGDFDDLINNGSWSVPSANGWNYYTDPFGYRHWFRRSTPYTLNFNISEGSVYLTDVDTWTLNTDISKLIFADIHCECNNKLVTGQIQGFTSTQLKTFYYAQTSGTSSVVVNLHLVFRP